MKPGPGTARVEVATGVMVLPSTRICGRSNGVKVGWLGSHVGMRTMVADGVGRDVFVLVGVSTGVKVAGRVAVSGGVLVAGLIRSVMEQAVSRIAKRRYTG